MQLHGPLRLRLESGTDITPGSQLRQAILAVLATASGQMKSRKTLQDMFWGSASSARASASLRTALHLLRRDLAALGEDMVRGDRQAVTLAPGRIACEPAVAPEAEFLEGLDLPLDDCEGFEDWLRDHRATPLPEPVAPDLPQRHQPSERHLALGLLPTLHAGLTRAELLRADALVDAMARAVAQITALDVHDLRGYEVQAVPLPIESGRGATHFAQALIDRRGKHLTLCLRLHDAASRRLIWVSDPADLATIAPEELAAGLCETLLGQIAATSAGQGASDLFPFTAITALFSLDDDLTRRTEAQILRQLASEPSPVLASLHAFAQVFKANEGAAPPDIVTPEGLFEALSHLPEAHPMLPLCHSLAGYSAHMLWGENILAEQMLDMAHARSPWLALNLDHMAVLRLMRGDVAGAQTAFRHCQQVGGSSPWRYTYDVTGSMIAMAQGDFREALHYANRALMRKPRFIGALRYAMAGFALADNRRDAQRMKDRIIRLRPDYDFSGWTENMQRRTPPHLAARLAQSLKTRDLI